MKKDDDTREESMTKAEVKLETIADAYQRCIARISNQEDESIKKNNLMKATSYETPCGLEASSACDSYFVTFKNVYVPVSISDAKQLYHIMHDKWCRGDASKKRKILESL